MDTDDQYFPTAAGLDESDEHSFTTNGGSVFPHAHDFTVVGGIFTSNNYSATPADPPDFRMIPWGDIDLQRDLSVNTDSGVIDRRGEHNCVRRVYSAKMDGRSSDFTAAVYQGDGAEQKWRQHVARYMSMRHPNIVQICAGASYGNLHAAVFHGDLIPFKRFMTGHSPILTVYLHGLYVREWGQVIDYHSSEFQRHLESYNCTFWIRSSSGRLCADFANPSLDDTVYFPKYVNLIPDVQGPTLFDAKNAETIAIQCLSLAQYHAICGLRLAKGRSSFEVAATTSVTPGAVFSWSMPPGEDFRNVPFEIASLPELRFHCDVDWFVLGEVGNLMGNGWTRMRYDANAPFNKEITLLVKAPRAHLAECWVPQANYIFSTQHIESNWEDYVLVDKVDFAVMIAEPTVDCPAGYLFLCPQEHFQVGISSLKWPDNPAYWSLDPLGVERLGGEEATQLGFPPFQLITRVQGCFWDASVYAGLRQFHRAKGFDPESQNVARHLGLPLYQLSRNIDPPFAHIGEHDRENKHWEDTEEDEDYWQLNMFSGDGPQPQSPLPGTSQMQDPQNDGNADEPGSPPIPHTIDEDTPVTLNILMNIQLLLMLFLAMCWM